jgi:hypothetical protein
MKTFTRDSSVRLKFNFRNADNAIVNPVSAQVSLSYKPHGGDGGSSGYSLESGFTVVTYPLAQSGDDWIYTWDSSVAAACIVAVHAETTDGPPTSAIDTEFRLKANRSNKELVGEF